MAVKDLVSGVLYEPISTSSTMLLVTIGENVSASTITSFFPATPFYITVMPKSPAVGVANRLDSEILQVTAVGNDQAGNAALTCVRGQRDTTAKAFDTGSIVTVGVYAEDAVLLGEVGTAVNPQPWIEASDIKDGAVTTDKIDWTTFNTNERVVGYYNNQPIYEQTIEYTLPASMTNPSSTNIPHGIPNLGYMLDVAMTIVLPDGRSLMVSKGIANDTYEYMGTLSVWVINSSNIVFKQHGMRDTIQGRPCIITMKYTKK